LTRPGLKGLLPKCGELETRGCVTAGVDPSVLLAPASKGGISEQTRSVPVGLTRRVVVRPAACRFTAGLPEVGVPG